MELTDKFKPNYLLKMLVLKSFANKLVILIIVVIKSVLSFGYNTIYKDKNCNSGFGYFKKSNIEKLKARFLLKELSSNINITLAEPPPKLCRRPRKTNTEKLL